MKRSKWKVPLWVIMTLLFLNVSEGFSENRISQKMTLLEAIEQISKDFEVYFTFDKTLVSDIKVNYDRRENENVEEAVSGILKGTKLNYKLFNQRYMIIYKNDEEGMKSLRKMSGYLDQLIRIEEKSILSRNNKTLKPYGESLKNLEDIKGTVVNEMGEPLIGVTILVKGT